MWQINSTDFRCFPRVCMLPDLRHGNCAAFIYMYIIQDPCIDTGASL